MAARSQIYTKRRCGGGRGQEVFLGLRTPQCCLVWNLCLGGALGPSQVFFSWLEVWGLFPLDGGLVKERFSTAKGNGGNSTAVNIPVYIQRFLNSFPNQICGYKSS